LGTHSYPRALVGATLTPTLSRPTGEGASSNAIIHNQPSGFI
jgi:hypothetical protein